MAVFAAVARAGGFAPAARQLGLSRSAVQKQVALLEDELGVRLLERTTRRARLTRAGEALAPSCAQLVALAEIGVRHARAHAEVPTGTLVVTASLGVGERWLGPKLATFLKAFPQVGLELRLEERNVDLVAEGVDVALRAGSLEDSSLVARRLADLPLVLVASPQLVGAATFDGPAALESLPWLVYSPMGSRVPLRQGDAQVVVELDQRIQINNGTVIRELAVQGVGLAMLPEFWVADALLAGTLVEVLPDWHGPRVPLYALTAHREGSLAARAFIDHVRER
ncbi:MAG: DNA-binding transcriptional LysR family regulator [Myxococcota bacterium]|jgi:DNA-binding transcriptional LysR family regulator